jgi:lysozyme family protein
VSFDAAFQKVVMVEGGYSDNPADSGGRTMYGITEVVARRNGYRGEMKTLPLETAKAIYRAQYWDLLRLDDVSAASAQLAEELFDTAVNCGVGIAGTFLQRSLNALNREQADYQDIEADGLVGPATLSALRAFLSRRGANGVTVLLRALNGLQAARYIELSERRQKDEAFVFGWLLNRVKI